VPAASAGHGLLGGAGRCARLLHLQLPMVLPLDPLLGTGTGAWRGPGTGSQATSRGARRLRWWRAFAMSSVRRCPAKYFCAAFHTRRETGRL